MQIIHSLCALTYKYTVETCGLLLQKNVLVYMYPLYICLSR